MDSLIVDKFLLAERILGRIRKTPMTTEEVCLAEKDSLITHVEGALKFLRDCGLIVKVRNGTWVAA